MSHVHMRSYNNFEKKNMSFLVNKSVEFTQLQITKTGKHKSCPDATLPMRTFFSEHNIYDYEAYSREVWGDSSKVHIETHILTESEDTKTETSFYRANKRGDRRYNIKKLSKYTMDDDIHVIFNIGKILYVINITRIDIEQSYNSPHANPIREILDTICQSSQSIAMELLGLLRGLSGKWLPTQGHGDTAVGRTIEFSLGLGYNSKPIPDYKGIELKSNRVKSNSKCTIFGRFPNWDISNLKKQDLIADYGHLYHDGIRRVFSTTATHNPNSNSFYIDINYRKNTLELLRQEDQIKDIVTWRLDEVHEALLNKHNETFWIDVYSKMEGEQEYMMLKQVVHTKAPNIGVFDSLIKRGLITMDAVIGRTTIKPDGKKSGNDNWNFRIAKGNRHLLFPQEDTYSLE